MMWQYVNYYCKNDNYHLQRIVDNIIASNFPWISVKDYDEFYSMASGLLWDCEKTYNATKGAKFETFFIGCLKRKIKTKVTYMNRKKRNSGTQDISIYSLIDDESQQTIGDVMMAERDESDEISERTQKYIDGLTALQKKIALLIMQGYELKDIKRILKLSDRRFGTVYNRMKSYDKTKVLYEKEGEQQ